MKSCPRGNTPVHTISIRFIRPLQKRECFRVEQLDIVVDTEMSDITKDPKEAAQVIPAPGTAADTAAGPGTSTTAPEEGAEGAAGPSKGELKRRAKEKEKARKAAERQAREEEEKRKREAAASVDYASQNYGKLPLHQSQDRPGQCFHLIKTFPLT